MGRGGGIAEVAGQDVRSASLAATATILATPGRLRGIFIGSDAAGGAVTLRDGGASGATKLLVTMPAVLGSVYIPIPDGGIPFQTDIHATLAAGIGTITIFYR